MHKIKSSRYQNQILNAKKVIFIKFNKLLRTDINISHKDGQKSVTFLYFN